MFRVVARAQPWILGVGAALTLLGLWVMARTDLHREGVDPYQCFLRNPHGIQEAIALLFAGYWVLWMYIMLKTAYWMDLSAPRLWLALAASTGVTMVAWFGVYSTLPILNAWLDFAAKTPTVVRVQEVSSRGAEVNRLDHPDESLVVATWPRRRLASGALASPIATLWVGRGAFGVPWISRIDRRPLEIGDAPLFRFPPFTAGQGQPLMLIALPGADSPTPEQARRRALLLVELREVARTGTITLPTLGAFDPVVDGALAGTLREDLLQMMAASRASATPSELLDRLRGTALATLGEVGLSPEQAADITPLLEQLTAASRSQRERVAAQAAQRLDALFSDRDRERAARRWVSRVERQTPETAIAIVWGDERSAHPFEIACAHCRTLRAEALDADLLALLVDGHKPLEGRGKVFLFDGKGAPTGVAELMDSKPSSSP